MEYSCGFFIVHKETKQFLLGHVTGFSDWSIPKGKIEENETPLQCAFRECREECGLAEDYLKKFPIYEIGVFKYANRPKKLHTFMCLLDGDKPENLRCTSTFVDKSGNNRPEFDKFAWSSLDCTYKIHLTQQQSLDWIKNHLELFS